MQDRFRVCDAGKFDATIDHPLVSLLGWEPLRKYISVGVRQGEGVNPVASQIYQGL